MAANFTPEWKQTTKQGAFRYWVQMVLPSIYDDSLSYMELLNRIVKILNEALENISNIDDNTQALLNVFNELQSYVNTYFESLDVDELINDKLDKMAEDGTLSNLIEPFLGDYNERITVLEARMDSFTNLPDGSTTGDAELIDGRTTFWGEVASNIGDAIRLQSELNYNALCNNALNLTPMDGYYNANGSWSGNTPNGEQCVIIQATQNDVIDVMELSDISQPLFCRFIEFDELMAATGDNISVQPTGFGLRKTYKVVNANTKLVAFCYRSYKDTDNPVTIKINKTTNGFNTEIESEYNVINNSIELNAYEYTTEDGYYNTDGSITGDTTYGEKHTNKLKLTSTKKIFIKAYVPVHNVMYYTVSEFDIGGNFIKRSSNLVPSGVSNVRRYGNYFESMYECEPTTEYVAISYRSYGVYNPEIYPVYNLDDTQEANIYPIDFNFETSNVKAINHRGYNSIAPENTLPAYKLSKVHGFTIVETDLRWTLDGVPVLLHDATINRTARNLDGSTIGTTYTVNDLTYNELLNYDFGIWKGAEYRGTKIPTLEEFVELCRGLGLHMYIELQENDNDDGKYQNVLDIINRYGMLDKTTFITFTISRLSRILELEPRARVGVNIMNTDTTTTASLIASLKTPVNQVFANRQRASTTQEFCDSCEALGIPVEVWIVSNREQRQALPKYVNGFTSDTYNAVEDMEAEYLE